MASMDMFLGLEQFEHEYIQFSSFQNGLNQIENAITTFRKTKIADNLRILGESGSGKTTLCQLVKGKYPRQVLKEQDIVPVLVVPVPSSVTIGSLIDAIFLELQYPIETKGTTSRRSAILIDLCIALKVEMIIFDEAQHLHDRGQAKTHYMVADWLKTLMDALSIPMVLVGLPNLEKLLQVNEQLRRRFSKKLYLALGQDAALPIQNECAILFHSLQEVLPLPFQSSESSMGEFYNRLYFACDGRIAYLKKLMLGALRMALENNLAYITPLEFELAFKHLIWWEGEKALNPFHADFEFRRLDRANEPFEKDAF